MKQPYTWLKRASYADHLEMRATRDSYNELAHENADIHGYTPEYRVERCGDMWGLVHYVRMPILDHKGDWFPEYWPGRRLDSASFVRCATCGAVRELFEGQGEFCPECWTDWD